MGVFQQGLSGLNTSQKSLEVTANNVANANTVGFKASKAQFGDVYASTLSRADAGLQVGGGVNIMAIKQEFRQGNVVATQNPLDLAISGNGFFKVKGQDGREFLTRNGQFQLDRDNTVTTADGKDLLAFPLDPDTGNVLDVASPVTISTEPIAPRATGKTEFRFNLDSRTQPSSISPTFDATDPNSYAQSSAIVINNQLGEPLTLQVFWQKLGAATTPASTGPNQWRVYATVNDVPVDISQEAAAYPGAPTTGAALDFSTDGTLNNPANAVYKIDLSALSPEFDSTNTDVRIDMRGSTQYGTDFQLQNLAQNGYDAADYTNFTIDGRGVLTLNYANGQTKDIAKIGLFRYRNPEGLQPVGNNNWVATLQAGPEFASNAGDAGFGLVQAGAVEEANVDLTAELVQMIATQRIYQANSKSIQAQDTLLQTITNLT
ncbi:flagellar hook protein FlgE [Limnobacter humi]|uniref:Flagellar hook protein FlgE n=1 Tax=Limnobacter humi TaxID=1778671 RepID=A0ABT1WJ19_9BURK|nr:flagellar hook protein FlgE [Limnobacter humi]MCQ8897499.1 flagellar hook protein FlgE [Limnobacter humi]